MAKGKYAFSSKVTKLVSVLYVHLTRIHFIEFFIFVIIEIGLGELIQTTTVFERNVKYSSYLHYIEDFSDDYKLDFQAIIHLSVSLEDIEDWENIIPYSLESRKKTCQYFTSFSSSECLFLFIGQ